MENYKWEVMIAIMRLNSKIAVFIQKKIKKNMEEGYVFL
jgi:hypothetical protein